MMMRIKKIEHICEYKLKLLFSDDKTKVVDFEGWIVEGGIYLLPLKNIEYFKKVKMDSFNYSICWPNGADFSPDVLYEAGQDIDFGKRPSTKRKTVPSKRSSKRTQSV
jgi:hypothetical protein